MSSAGHERRGRDRQRSRSRSARPHPAAHPDAGRLGATALGGGHHDGPLFVVVPGTRYAASRSRPPGSFWTYQALLGLVLAPLVGTLRRPHRSAAGGCCVACLVEAGATLAFGFVTTVPQAVGVATVMRWATPARGRRRRRCSRGSPGREHRQRVFGLQFMLLTSGSGLRRARRSVDPGRPRGRHLHRGCTHQAGVLRLLPRGRPPPCAVCRPGGRTSRPSPTTEDSGADGADGDKRRPGRLSGSARRRTPAALCHRIAGDAHLRYGSMDRRRPRIHDHGAPASTRSASCSSSTRW